MVNDPTAAAVVESVRRTLAQEETPADTDAFAAHVADALANREVMLASASRFGTPQYLLDEKLLIARATAFRRAFERHIGNVRCFYAFKSNDLPYQIKLLRSCGFEADVAGGFELQLALEMGFDRIIYTSPYKTAEELQLALAHRDRVVINIDHAGELAIIETLLAAAPQSRAAVSLRVRPQTLAPAWHKFGVALDELPPLVARIRAQGQLRLAGLHFHSSWNPTPDAQVANIERLGAFCHEAFTPAELADLRFLDIGGGYLPEGKGRLFAATDKGILLERFAAGETDSERLQHVCPERVAPIEDFAAAIARALRAHLRNPPLERIAIWLEPGRYLSSVPTSILMRVQHVKGDLLMVDGGIQLLGGDAFNYSAWPIVNLTRPSGERRRAMICGPLCDPDDHWGYAYYGDPCRPGDVLAVLHQGAYSFSTAWRWQRPIAPYIAFAGERLLEVKAAETFDQRYAGCLR